MTFAKKILMSASLLSLLFLTACGQPVAQAPNEEKPTLEVKGQTVAQSRSVKQRFEYPALVLSQEEAKIIAKTSGTVKQLNFKLGDSVTAGSLLARIDDINQGGSLGSGLNSSQIRQARLAVEQAEINKRNISLTSAETLKSAQISYDTAKIATEQARLSLENRQTGSNQTSEDAEINANTTASSVADASGSILTGINSITNFDPTSVSESPYKNNLGVSNYQQGIDAKNIYLATKELYDKYQSASFSDVKTKVNEAIKLIEQTNRLISITKKYVDSSLVGGSLTQTILSGFQTAVAGYQTQINTALAQINGAKQALENNQINNDTNLDALAKAYEIAKQQEKNAAQALNTQKAGIKSSLDAADLQYRNALLALQSLIDIHQVIAPISGKITQNSVSLGDTVSPGQQLAIISSGQTIKFQFYVDEEVLKKITPDQGVIIKNNSGKEIAGKIVSLGGQADPLTKRFLVEVAPLNFQPSDFTLGTVVNISISVEEKSASKNIILPLSAIEIGQSSNAVFTIEEGLAKKIPAEIVKINGETAEIKTALSDSAVIVVDGNKLIQEGDKVTLK